MIDDVCQYTKLEDATVPRKETITMHYNVNLKEQRVYVDVNDVLLALRALGLTESARRMSRFLKKNTDEFETKE